MDFNEFKKSFFPKVDIINKSGVELEYATERSSGMDLVANIEDSLFMDPMDRILIPTGIFVKMDPGTTEIQVRPKSGLALKKGLTVLNTPGTIDNDYHKEIQVILINLSMEVQEIKPKQKIAQMVFGYFIQPSKEKINFVDSFDTDITSDRTGGFGSTGEFGNKIVDEPTKEDENYLPLTGGEMKDNGITSVTSKGNNIVTNGTVANGTVTNGTVAFMQEDSAIYQAFLKSSEQTGRTKMIEISKEEEINTANVGTSAKQWNLNASTLLGRAKKNVTFTALVDEKFSTVTIEIEKDKIINCEPIELTLKNTLLGREFINQKFDKESDTEENDAK